MQGLQGSQESRSTPDRPLCIDCRSEQQFSENDSGGFMLLVNDQARFLCDACAATYASREEAFKHLMLSARASRPSITGDRS